MNRHEAEGTIKFLTEKGDYPYRTIAIGIISALLDIADAIREQKISQVIDNKGPNYDAFVFEYYDEE